MLVSIWAHAYHCCVVWKCICITSRFDLPGWLNGFPLHYLSTETRCRVELPVLVSQSTPLWKICLLRRFDEVPLQRYAGSERPCTVVPFVRVHPPVISVLSFYRYCLPTGVAQLPATISSPLCLAFTFSISRSVVLILLRLSPFRLSFPSWWD